MHLIGISGSQMRQEDRGQDYVPKHSLGSLWHLGVQTEPKSQGPNKASWHGGGCSRSVRPCILGNISHSWPYALSRSIGRAAPWTPHLPCRSVVSGP